MCRPRDPDVLGNAGHLQRLELVAHPAGDVEHLRERGAVAGIEIDRDVVGVERRLHAREPRVLRDRGELRHVEQRDERSADESLGAGLVDRIDVGGQHFDAHASRRLFLLLALLIERDRIVDAVRKSLHDERTIGDDGEDERRDGRVVAQQVALGQLELRPEELGQVGDARCGCRRAARWRRPGARPRGRAAGRRPAASGRGRLPLSGTVMAALLAPLLGFARG